MAQSRRTNKQPEPAPPLGGGILAIVALAGGSLCLSYRLDGKDLVGLLAMPSAMASITAILLVPIVTKSVERWQERQWEQAEKRQQRNTAPTLPTASAGGRA